MARYGEGDARWIVEDRADGQNVNQWHWSEKDVTDWARKRLKELLGGLTLVDDDKVAIKIDSVTSVTGEAAINIRKQKMISVYELDLKAEWEGTLKGGDNRTASGKLQLPYIAEENADEDPEVLLSLPTETAEGQQLKASINAQGKKAIYDAVKQFVKEIHAGGPYAGDRGSAALSASPAAPSASAATASALAPPPKAQAKKQPAPTSGRRSLSLREQFYARPQDVFECFTDARRVKAFTQSEAVIEPSPGGRFSIYGGSVQGVFREVEAPTKIALDWRFNNWQDGLYSKVSITLEEPQEGTTILTLQQDGIPAEDKYGNEDVVSSTEVGWKQQIFHRIRAVFGFGL